MPILQKKIILNHTTQDNQYVWFFRIVRAEYILKKQTLRNASLAKN